MIWILILIGLISLIADILLKKKIKAINEAIELLPADIDPPKNPLKTLCFINNIIMYVALGLLVYLQFIV